MRKPNISWGIKFEIAVQCMLWVAAAILTIKIVLIAKIGSDEFLIEVTPFISLIIACIAANATIIALRKTGESLKITRESLKLTRNSQRPFITVKNIESGSLKKDKVPVKISVINSGVFPANNINVHLEFFAEDENVRLYKSAELYKSGTVYRIKLHKENADDLVFPNQIYFHEYHLYRNNNEHNQLIKDWIAHHKIKILVTITYESRIQGYEEKHKTILTLKNMTTTVGKYGLFHVSPSYYD